jgi:hypothetical protein
LNCGATLDGRFCSACGQRVVPPHPTVHELAGDAWNELSGYDGRIAATFRGLLKPGLLTRRYVEGQRARYLPPVRLYLIVSVVYFLVAAAAPSLDPPESGRQTVGPGVRIDITGPGSGARVSAEDRKKLLENIDQAPWVFRPIMRALAEDPEAFRRNLFTIMPRVFFALLPVFAGIVALFYRGQRFPTSLVFAVHVHAFVFVALTLSEAFKFTGSRIVAAVVGAGIFLCITSYVFLALRGVFGGRALATAGKMVAIGLLYMLAALPAFLIIVVWAAVS